MLAFRKFVPDKFMGMTDVEVKELKKEVKKYIDHADVLLPELTSAFGFANLAE